MGSKLLGLFLLLIISVLVGYTFRFQMTQHTLDVSYYNAQQANKMALILASKIDRQTMINYIDENYCKILFSERLNSINKNNISFRILNHRCNANYSQVILEIDTPNVTEKFDVTHIIQVK